jgi:hypothetical protein
MCLGLWGHSAKNTTVRALSTIVLLVGLCDSLSFSGLTQMLFNHRKRRRFFNKLRVFLIKVTVTVAVCATALGAFLQWISTLELTDNHVRVLWILTGLIFLVIAAIEIRHIIERGITRSMPAQAKQQAKQPPKEGRGGRVNGDPTGWNHPEPGMFYTYADYFRKAREERAKAAQAKKVANDDDVLDEYIGDVGVGRVVTKWFERRRKSDG